MPYADPVKQREYQRNFLRARREQWLEENGPCVDCGSWQQLEVDHEDPSTKVTHSVWSWRAARREIELRKCRPRCRRCHLAKTAREAATNPAHGTVARYSGSSPCRCDACRAAERESKRMWRLRTGKTQTYYNRRKRAERATISPG